MGTSICPTLPKRSSKVFKLHCIVKCCLSCDIAGASQKPWKLNIELTVKQSYSTDERERVEGNHSLLSAYHVPGSLPDVSYTQSHLIIYSSLMV